MTSTRLWELSKEIRDLENVEITIFIGGKGEKLVKSASRFNLTISDLSW